MYRTSLLLLALSAPAFASDTFPPFIQNKYSLASQPLELCALCHTNGITGLGTVNTPFGKAVRMHGLVAGDTATLNAALDAMATEGVDSDGDGVTDVAELMADTSPNVSSGGTGGGAGGGGGGTVLAPPRYGCGASVVPGLLFFASLLPLLRSRRRQP